MPHVYIDGDDVGCMLALRAALRSLGKDVYLFSGDPVPAVYSYLPDLDSVRPEPPQGAFDAAILLECSSPHRISPLIDLPQLTQCVINIDHHIDNDYFGHLNWVDPQEAALGEMVYDLIKKLKVELDYTMAVSLYTSIFSDTGSFQYQRVDPHTHKILADLLRFPIPTDEIARRIYREKPWNLVKLEGQIINAMERSEDGRVAWSVLTQAMLSQTGVSDEDTQYAIELVSQVRGAEVHLLFKEGKDGRVRVSFRSNGTPVNQ
ncbi:MAG: DHH family phosphoesterase, partial [Candidatus Xenobia bacterium]